MTKTTDKSFGFYDLVEQFAEPGCPVCALLLKDAGRLLDKILYELVTDPPTQTAFRTSRGLCSEHGQELIEFSHALGIAILYEAVLDATLKALDKAEYASPGGLSRLWNPPAPNAALTAALEPSAPCVACAAQNENEARYIQILSDHIGEEKLAEAYRASDGLCREHFQMVISATHDAERTRRLVTIQRDIWIRLRAELREFARKYDFKHAAEKMGAEGDSWRRAVSSYSGNPAVMGLRRFRK